MARGQRSTVGEERVAPNGYHYVRCEEGWRLKHHLIAEVVLGRPIKTDQELVKFKDGKRDNLDPKNIEVIPRKTGSLRRRKAVIETRIEELEAELAEINKALRIES